MKLSYQVSCCLYPFLLQIFCQRPYANKFRIHFLIKTEMVSAVDSAKRALVSLIKRLAALYAVSLSLLRESPDSAVRTSYRKLSRKTHPDHGGILGKNI